MNPFIEFILNWVMMIGTGICVILSIYISIFLIKESRKLTKSKVIVYTYRIGQRPDFDIKKFKHPYITVEKRGVIIFVYSIGKKYENSLFKTESIIPLLEKIEKERLCNF